MAAAHWVAAQSPATTIAATTSICPASNLVGVTISSGAAWFKVGGHPVYRPWQILSWWVSLPIPSGRTNTDTNDQVQEFWGIGVCDDGVGIIAKREKYTNNYTNKSPSCGEMRQSGMKSWMRIKPMIYSVFCDAMTSDETR